MSWFIIRNDLTGQTWEATAGEARLYAVGGELDEGYSVFNSYGAPTPLSIYDI